MIAEAGAALPAGRPLRRTYIEAGMAFSATPWAPPVLGFPGPEAALIIPPSDHTSAQVLLAASGHPLKQLEYGVALLGATPRPVAVQPAVGPGQDFPLSSLSIFDTMPRQPQAVSVLIR